ncbi:recombinase family protein [Streptomyces atratus]|uniref:recombinase family protein n=1 Tax=Streptomyces atratus TaxID=1893 RepID=UPI0027E44A4A|nr:recombinase family protein [Streptomyces atratus]
MRIGYARCSTAQQELASQLAALEPVCKRIFSEKISTRVKVRPERRRSSSRTTSRRPLPTRRSSSPSTNSSGSAALPIVDLAGWALSCMDASRRCP